MQKNREKEDGRKSKAEDVLVVGGDVGVEGDRIERVDRKLSDGGVLEETLELVDWNACEGRKKGGKVGKGQPLAAGRERRGEQQQRTESVPQESRVGEDDLGHKLRQEDGANLALPDLPLLLECRGGAHLMSGLGDAREPERPGSDAEGVAGAVGEREEGKKERVSGRPPHREGRRVVTH
jgi:hypothetical protein